MSFRFPLSPSSCLLMLQSLALYSMFCDTVYVQLVPNPEILLPISKGFCHNYHVWHGKSLHRCLLRTSLSKSPAVLCGQVLHWNFVCFLSEYGFGTVCVLPFSLFQCMLNHITAKMWLTSSMIFCLVCQQRVCDFWAVIQTFQIQAKRQRNIILYKVFQVIFQSLICCMMTNFVIRTLQVCPGLSLTQTAQWPVSKLPCNRSIPSVRKGHMWYLTLRTPSCQSCQKAPFIIIRDLLIGSVLFFA